MRIITRTNTKTTAQMTTIKTMVMLILMISMSSLINAQELNFTLNSQTTYDETIDLGIVSSFAKDGNTFTWIQEIGGQSHTSELAIVSSEGNWDVDNSEGQLIYHLMEEGSGISLTITGGASGITAEFTMPSNDAEAPVLVYSFTECTINYL